MQMHVSKEDIRVRLRFMTKGLSLDMCLQLREVRLWEGIPSQSSARGQARSGGLRSAVPMESQ